MQFANYKEFINGQLPEKDSSIWLNYEKTKSKH